MRKILFSLASLLLIGAGCARAPLPVVQAPDSEETCAVAAKAYYARSGRTSESTATYASHYHRESGVCFMEITDTQFGVTQKTFFDLWTEKEYARSASDPSSKEIPFSCMTDGADCGSEKDYDAFVKARIEN